MNDEKLVEELEEIRKWVLSSPQRAVEELDALIEQIETDSGAEGEQ